jgi:exonuclease SbcC
MAEGVRDTGRYVHSVLGMDDAAFRASVFAEQKQLAAFSDQSPAERRKLVLALLGITPLDGARDRARADARHTAEQHTRLRAMLPDLEEARVSAADAEARAAAAEAEASEEENAAAAARQRSLEAKDAFARVEHVHQEHERLLLEGKAARAIFDAARGQAADLSAELAGLARAQVELAELAPLAARLPAAEEVSRLLGTILQASRDLAAVPIAEEPPQPDEAALAQAGEAAMAARVALGSAQGRRQAAAGELDLAQAALARSRELSGEQDCPLCGQSLGAAFAKVQEHRAAEVAAAKARLAASEATLAEAERTMKQALARSQELSSQAGAARLAHEAWQHGSARRGAAAERLRGALEVASDRGPALLDELASTQAAALAGAMTAVLARPSRGEPSPDDLATALRAAEELLSSCRKAAENASRLRGRLERMSSAENALAQAEERAATAGSKVEALRSKVKTLGFDPTFLAAAQAELDGSEAIASQATAAATAARESAIKARAQAEGEAKRVADAMAQHAKLAQLESESLHLSRVSDLLSAFRNDVVASVGPRLAVQAAELFAELTDNEYDLLEVDAETYGLQIRDAGLSYGLDRFSGSEIDLANLALRVAISEQIRFQSGGTVGLLVLDEVFGPLDEERKARMLLALERLKGRFRQVLVVTHSTDIKEQLPNAIEVVKRPGRRATARVVS